MKKYSCCPVCGSSGEDMLFAFYCGNEKCQNFRVVQEEEPTQLTYHTSNNVEDEKELGVFSVYGYWPYGD